MKVFIVLLSLIVSLNAMNMEHDDHSADSTSKKVQAIGTIKSIGEGCRFMRIFHEPIADLKWPAMNMKFDVAEPSLCSGIAEGDKVHFDFVYQNGKTTVTKIQK